MEFTINCTRVPIPQGTTLYGIPVDESPVPAKQGPVSNDGDALNPDGFPDGWVSPNREESVPGQITPTKHRLGQLGRLEQLGLNAKSQNIDLIAIQEHRFYHPNEILKYHTVGSYQLVTSSASKNTINSTV